MNTPPTDPATILVQKRTALANLEAIIASGIQTTQHGDRRVQYQELAQMRAEAQRLRDEIAAMDGTGPTARRARMRRFYFDHSRGF